MKRRAATLVAAVWLMGPWHSVGSCARCTLTDMEGPHQATRWTTARAGPSASVSVLPSSQGAAVGHTAAELAYRVTPDAPWVSITFPLDGQIDLTPYDVLAIWVLGDGGGEKLHLDLVDDAHGGFFRATTTVDWTRWRRVLTDIPLMRAHGAGLLCSINAVRVSVEAESGVVEGRLVLDACEALSGDDVPAMPTAPPGQILFTVHGHDPVGDKYIYTTDLEGWPVDSRIQYLTSDLLRVAPPHNAPVVLNALWELPRLGTVIVAADNGGRGFLPSADGPVDLNTAFAETKIATLVRECDQPHTPDDIRRETARLREELQALMGGDHRSPDERARAADALAGRAGALLETLALHRAQADIERCRKADAELTVISPDGIPIPAASVTVRQVGSDFLFGTHPVWGASDDDATPDEIFDAGGGMFNFGLVIPATGLRSGHGDRPYTEDELAQLWAQTDRAIAMQQELGHPPQANVDLWMTDSLGRWLRGLPFESLRRSVGDAVAATVSRFRGRVGAWLVVNEAHDWANVLGLDRRQLVQITRDAVEAARRADPGAPVIVNCCLPWGLYLHWLEDYTLMTPYAYLEDLIEAGVPFDVVGLQTYTGFSCDFPARDLYDMSRLLDRYAALGKPIWITEFCCPSEGRRWGAWHGHSWDEHSQAEYAAGYYTLAFSKPYVGSIRWFGMRDGSFPLATGLLHRDGTPKEAYRSLGELGRRWRTQVQATTDAKGRVAFRGFLGQYRATVKTPDGRSASASFHVGRKGAVVCVVLGPSKTDAPAATVR